MSDHQDNPPLGPGNTGNPGNPSGGGASGGGGKPGQFDSGFVGHQVRQPAISARVPEHVVRGVFSSGALVVGGGAEFILDFVLRMSRPYLVASRVILPHPAMPSVIACLRQNLDLYAQRFGGYPKMPKPVDGAEEMPQPTIHEIYDDLKLTDEIACGAYAHGLMASFTASEYCLDFIAHFLPRPTVTARVYLAAPQMPRLLDGLSQTYDTHMRRLASQNKPRGDAPPAPAERPPEPNEPERG